MTAVPAGSPLDEARRLSDLAREAGITARLLGGVAVALSAADPLPPSLQRPYKDLDYVVPRAQAPRWRDLLEAQGYVPDSGFNALHGAHRLLHFDRTNDRQLDTFVSAFAMCHSLDLEDRLPEDSPTLAPEDILLTKLQIFEVNDKDLIDTIALLLLHPVVSGGAKAGIDEKRIADLVGGDWGWYTTLSDNLAKVEQRVASSGLDQKAATLVRDRIRRIQHVLATAPKTLKWKLRAKVGRRVPWYDLPEEVD